MKTSRHRLVSVAELDRKMAMLGDRFTIIQRGEAIRREELIRRWDIAKRGGWELGLTGNEATAAFVRTVQDRFGIIVSARSLAGWEKRWRNAGLAGLIDLRMFDKLTIAMRNRGNIEGRS